MGSLENKGNILGDVRAENDHAMLDAAFYDWQDYKILFEAQDRFLVVGRRGTGKSALTYRLRNEWKEKKAFVVVVAPDEEDVIGLRATASRYGKTLTRIRAAIKTGWRYALIMEIADSLNQYYKTQRDITSSELNVPLKHWKSLGENVTSRLRRRLNEVLLSGELPEDSISELASRLDVNKLRKRRFNHFPTV
jgi:KaiC/GvpD/RAD55 family RecA-like ATPase